NVHADAAASAQSASRIEAAAGVAAEISMRAGRGAVATRWQGTDPGPLLGHGKQSPRHGRRPRQRADHAHRRNAARRAEGRNLLTEPIVHDIVIALAAFAAGAINSIAGGGTLISFPALVWIGFNPVMANATNSFALWPGSFAAMVGFRRDLARIRRWPLLLTIPALAGGGAGGTLPLPT